MSLPDPPLPDPADRGPEGEGRFHPRSPTVGVLFAVLFLTAAILGLIPFVTQFVPAATGQLYGQRTEGFVLFGPLVFGAIGVITLVRGIRAIGPWRDYRSRTTPEQRRVDLALDGRGQKVAIPLFFGVCAFLGQIALLVFVRFGAVPTLTGQVLFVEVNVLLFLVWIAIAGLVAQTLYYRRYLPAAS